MIWRATPNCSFLRWDALKGWDEKVTAASNHQCRNDELCQLLLWAVEISSVCIKSISKCLNKSSGKTALYTPAGFRCWNWWWSIRCPFWEGAGGGGCFRLNKPVENHSRKYQSKTATRFNQRWTKAIKSYGAEKLHGQHKNTRRPTGSTGRTIHLAGCQKQWANGERMISSGLTVGEWEMKAPWMIVN